MKQMIKFIMRRKTTRGKMQMASIMLYGIICIPAFLFHEMTHWITAKIVASQVEFVDWCFFKSSPNNFRIYNGAVKSFCKTTTASILVSIAPLIGWILLITISIIFHYWLILIYCIFAYKVFFVSKGDIENIRDAGFNTSICNIMYIIADHIEDSYSVTHG